MAVVGIDLGTTFCAVAHVDKAGVPRILSNRDEQLLTPSVVFFNEDDNDIVIGTEAKNSSEAFPDQTVEFVKNHMGSDKTYTMMGKTYNPQLVSALILKRLIQDAEEKIGEKITGAVITVPAIFGEAQRFATKEAAEMAGIELLALLNEPEAAAISYGLTKEEKGAIADLFLLTDKPILYVANVDEASMHTGNKFSAALMDAVKNEGNEVIVMTNAIEAQIAEFEDADDKAMFMEEYKMTEPALDRLIHSTYKLLNLSTYFTAGVQEVRAWTIHQGWKAPQAASVIHTDFEKGFIKAEVIAYEDFIQYKSEAACRENGRLRIEGKEYVVKDGDVMHFRFNV